MYLFSFVNHPSWVSFSVQKTGSTKDLPKLLGTGNPEAERNWQELFQVLRESPELMYERDSRRKPVGTTAAATASSDNPSATPRPSSGPSSSKL
jgi:hypothetical protein